jgi:hypothetical protein
MVKNKKNMFFLQVFFYICLWIVEVFSRSDVVRHFGGTEKNANEKNNNYRFHNSNFNYWVL